MDINDQLKIDVGFVNHQMAHIATFFLTVNYGLNAFLRLQEKVKNLQVSSVSAGNETWEQFLWTFKINWNQNNLGKFRQSLQK